MVCSDLRLRVLRIPGPAPYPPLSLLPFRKSAAPTPPARGGRLRNGRRERGGEGAGPGILKMRNLKSKQTMFKKVAGGLVLFSFLCV